MRSLSRHTQTLIGPLMLQHLADLVSPGVGAEKLVVAGTRASGMAESMLEAAGTTGVHVISVDHETGTLRMSE